MLEEECEASFSAEGILGALLRATREYINPSTNNAENGLNKKQEYDNTVKKSEDTNKEVAEKEDLIVAEREATAPEDITYKCHDCDAKLTNYRHLYIHRRKVHKEIKCHECDAKFTEGKHLLIHWRGSHRKVTHKAEKETSQINTLEPESGVIDDIKTEESIEDRPDSSDDNIKDIMEIMTHNAILSTSEEETIQNPTIIESPLAAVKVNIKKNILQNIAEIATEISDINIVAKFKINLKLCHDCDAQFTNENTLINHKENTHKAEKTI